MKLQSFDSDICDITPIYVCNISTLLFSYVFVNFKEKEPLTKVYEVFNHFFFQSCEITKY